MNFVLRIVPKRGGSFSPRSSAPTATIGKAFVQLGLATISAIAISGQSVAKAGESNDGFAFPGRLSQTGLYDPDGRIDRRNLAFVPQYPLWTDGAKKSRWIYLPEGTTIDVSDVDVWRFPVGTKLWKEFAWNGRKVETRLIWKSSEERWDFATYVWNEDQTDAVLAPQDGISNLAEIAPGKRHSIPGVSDCRSCHESSPAIVLGFNALQLSDDRDSLAPHAEPVQSSAVTLKTLFEARRLDPVRPDLVKNPPRVRASSATARAAIGYLSANCGGCHNSTGPLARLGLDLLYKVGEQNRTPERALLSMLNSRGRFVVPGIPPDSSRYLFPGAPEKSALLYRVSSRRPSSQMPPLGTVLVDDEAVALIRSWISSLDTSPLLSLE